MNKLSLASCAHFHFSGKKSNCNPQAKADVLYNLSVLR